MSDAVTNPAQEQNHAVAENQNHENVGKGKGKALQSHDDAMDDEEEDEDGDGEDEEPDEDMDEDELEALKDDVDPSDYVAPGTRRSTRQKVDYTSEEALKAAQIKADEKEGDEDEEYHHDISVEAEA